MCSNEVEKTVKDLGKGQLLFGVIHNLIWFGTPHLQKIDKLFISNNRNSSQVGLSLPFHG